MVFVLFLFFLLLPLGNNKITNREFAKSHCFFIMISKEFESDQGGVSDEKKEN